MQRRVVVTGMGMVTPGRRDLESTWSALQEGRSGVGPISLFDASSFPTKIAAEVKGFDLADYVSDPGSTGREHCRNTLFAIAAGQMAIDDSGLVDQGPTSTPRGSASTSARARAAGLPPVRQAGPQRPATTATVDTSSAFTREGLKELHPIHESEQEPGTPAGHLAGLFGARGPNANCLTACAASSQAIGEATEIIRRGDADVMLSGGTHSMIHPFGVTGFNLLTALSTRNDEPTRASRPFDRDRDGFILGEGAGMVILEELEHAKARGRGSTARSPATARPPTPSA